MENLKHTKGTWIIKSDYSIYESTIKTIKGVRIAEVKSYGTKKPFKDATVEERLANQKLIASAPELLEALIEAQQLIKAYVPNDINDGSFNGGVKQMIKEAIEKATK
jgi:vacuolar-type H+-ATPase subunit D/Vma8